MNMRNVFELLKLLDINQLDFSKNDLFNKANQCKVWVPKNIQVKEDKFYINDTVKLGFNLRVLYFKLDLESDTVIVTGFLEFVKDKPSFIASLIAKYLPMNDTCKLLGVIPKITFKQNNVIIKENV